MVKLSAQLEQATPTRLTRTERQIAQRERVKQLETDKQQFEELKARAEDVQQEKLSGLQSIDDYAEIYQTIDPELQQFFQTPTELRSSQSEKIEASKTKLVSEIERVEGLKQKQDIAYQQSLAEVPLLDPSGRSEFKRDIKNEYKIASASIDAELGGLREGLTKLDAGQDISVGEIKSFSKARAGESADVERKAIRFQSKPRLTVTTTPIDPEKYVTEKLKGLTSEGITTVRNITGGQSDVEILSVKGGERIQVVREKETGKIYITDLEGAKKGERIEAQGLSDREINLQQLEALKKAQAEREAFVDIEAIPEPEGNFATKILKTLGNIVKVAGDQPFIPFFSFTGLGGRGVGDITIRDVTKKAGEGIGKGVGFVAEKIFIGDIKVPIFDPKDPRSYIGVPSLSIEGVPSIETLAGFPDQQTIKVREITDFTKEKISLKQEELALKQIKKLGIREEFDPKFEAEYQARFEDKYGVRLIAGDITFEQAEKEFRTSDEAKLVQERYGQVIEKKKKGIITTETAGMLGLSIASLGIKLVPETTGELIVTTALVYTGTSVLKAIPTKALLTAEGVFGVHGGLQAFDPTLAGEKRLMGGIIATTIGLHLGFKAIKYLKTPTIKTVKISSPKATLKAESVLAKEGKIYKITKDGQIILRDKTIFEAQKRQIVGVAGRRTVVNIRYRDILKLDPIYRGVPTAQRGTTYSLSSLRGDYTYTTLSGYQKAFKLLSKSNQALLTTGDTTKLISLKGFSGSQIKAILKYTAPKVFIQTLEKGELLTTGITKKAQYTYLTEQPVISVDKSLGIKTRGARTIRDIYNVEGKIVGRTGDFTVVQESVRKTTMFATKKGASYNLLKQAGRTQTQFIRQGLVRVGETKKFFSRLDIQILKRNKVLLDFSKKFPYEAQDIGGAFAQRQTVPLQRKITLDAGKTTLIKKIGKRQVVDINIDEAVRKATGISYKSDMIIKPFPIKKTPLVRTFAEEKVITQIKDIIKKTKPVTFDYVDDAVSSGSKITKQSKWAGTGLYERTEGAIGGLDFSQTQINTALKTSFTPTLNIKTQIKALMKFDSAIIPTTTTKSILKTILTLKAIPKLKQDLKLDLGLKFDLGVRTDLKTLIKQTQVPAQAQRLSTAQLLKTAEVSIFAPSITSPITVTPTFKLPVIPIPIIPFYLPIKEPKKKKKVRDKILQQQLAFLPDFTSRALGLDPDILTESQALKQIRKIQTGFELRKPVRIKPNKLLKGIPK